MMKIQNEASVNLLLDPALQIKRYEKEIRDLKQELAMRDTLQNRGRVNYSDYTQREQQEIQDLTEKFLDEKTDDVGPIDSLRRVREIFNCIRLQYRHTLQNVEAMKRQIDSNP
jgi:kinesin family member 6/9